MKKFLAVSVFLNFVLFGIIIYGLISLGLLPPFQDTFEESSSISELNLDSYSFEDFTTGLEIPWAVVHIDDNTKLVTERPGRVQLIKNGVLIEEPVLELDVANIGESGLMGMTVDQEFEMNNYIYLYHSYYNSENKITLKVSRYTFENNVLSDEFIVIDNIPGGEIHSSGEISFGPEGKLYITTGDVGDRDLAQEPSSLAGKTLRINKDGTIPHDNPFLDDENTKDEIFSFGHRNAQGIDWHPETFEMFQSEHGPSGFDGGVGQDEINLVRRGLNYGWPIISGMETQTGYETPLIQYTPAIAPGSLIVYDGKMFPELYGKILVAGLRGNTIKILEFENNEIEEVGQLVDDRYGRIRDLSIDLDGAIYFTTSNRDGRGEVRDGDDRIVRVSK